MRAIRIAVIASLLFFSGIVEATWLTMFALPGVVPPLAFVMVMSFAIRRSPASAALLGFAAGAAVGLLIGGPALSSVGGTLVGSACSNAVKE